VPVKGETVRALGSLQKKVFVFTANVLTNTKLWGRKNQILFLVNSKPPIKHVRHQRNRRI
jgi:hypothetical protein